MPPQTELERFKGFCQVWGCGVGGEGLRGDRTISNTYKHTDGFFSQSVSLVQSREWVRDSGSPRCEWSRGEDACLKKGERFFHWSLGGDPSQSHQPFMKQNIP